MTLPGVRIAWAEDGSDGPRATGRALLRELGAEVTAVCARCGGPHGKPRAGDREASVSHAGGVTLVALAEPGIRVGVDLEREDATAPGMSVQEWTRIEAVLKADGRGLDVPPERVRITGSTAMLDGVVYALSEVLIPGFTATAAAAALPTAAIAPRTLPHPRRPR